MGIRFACPNGHKLNVKEEFAGKRAICPKCDAKVVVPDQSTRAVKGAKQNAPASEPPPIAADASPSPPEAPAAGDWHVRSVTGEQYGPADAATMRQWIADGRVAADSWVWRTGWEDWQPGAAAMLALGATARAEDAEATMASDAPREQLPDGPSAAPQSTAELRRRTLARRRQRSQRITIGLIVLTLALAVVLAIVLSK